MSGTSIWWRDEERYFLNDTLAHINSSRSRDDPVSRCDDLCKALNKTWNAFYCFRQQKGDLTDTEARNGASDAQAFRQLLLTGITPDEASEFCESGSLRALAELNPQIMSHKKLMEQKYDPFSISDKVRRTASEQHKRFTNAYRQYLQAPRDDRIRDAFLKKTAEVVYVVRCNIDHSEKTPKGPDLEKAKRDRTVSEVASAVIEDFFEILFDHPSHRLAVYGTLAPGKPNALLLAEITGRWVQGAVSGDLDEQDGLYVFHWVAGANVVSVQVLDGSGLKAHFDRLDRFEGPRYQRILVPVSIDGRVSVCNIFEGVSQQHRLPKG